MKTFLGRSFTPWPMVEKNKLVISEQSASRNIGFRNIGQAAGELQ